MNDNKHTDNFQQKHTTLDNWSPSTGTGVDYSCLSDENLCELSQGGNKNALDALIRRYYHQVSVLSRNYFMIGGTGDDLEQEGLIGLLTAIYNYNSGLSSFRTFAQLCIKRNIVDIIRKSQNKNNQFYNNSMSLDELDQLSSYTYHPMEQDPEAQVIGKDDQMHIETQILSKLSDFEQHVLTLYLNGFSYSEIASAVSKSVKAVDNAVQRVRRKIQNNFGS